jgi:hypothetical protein
MRRGLGTIADFALRVHSLASPFEYVNNGGAH